VEIDGLSTFGHNVKRPLGRRGSEASKRVESTHCYSRNSRVTKSGTQRFLLNCSLIEPKNRFCFYFSLRISTYLQSHGNSLTYSNDQEVSEQHMPTLAHTGPHAFKTHKNILLAIAEPCPCARKGLRLLPMEIRRSILPRQSPRDQFEIICEALCFVGLS